MRRRIWASICLSVVGVLAIALAWIVGVYVAGMPVAEVISGFPRDLFVTLAGVTLLWLEPVPVTVGATLAAVAAAGVFVRRGSAGRPSSGSPANPVEEQL